MDVFKIYQQDEKQFITRLVYPKFTAEITFNSNLSDLEHIEVHEDVLDAMDIARAMREAGDYLLSVNKN